MTTLLSLAARGTSSLNHVTMTRGFPETTRQYRDNFVPTTSSLSVGYKVTLGRRPTDDAHIDLGKETSWDNSTLV